MHNGPTTLEQFHAAIHMANHDCCEGKERNPIHRMIQENPMLG